jgi:uncharacterized protein YjiK
MKNILIIIVLTILTVCLPGCNQKRNTEAKLLKTIKLDVPEPSGLMFSEDLKSLWTVSDENSTVYNINMDGKILKSFRLNGFDLEGITTINDSLLAVIFERTREVAVIDTLGNEIKRYKLGIPGNDNQGIEGITFNTADKHFFIIKEKNPCLLLEYDFDFNLLKKDTLNFSSDVSGLFYNKVDNLLWILSDENSCVNIVDMQRVVQQKLTFNLIQPEGITFNAEKKLLYVVSDKEEELYIFQVE